MTCRSLTPFFSNLLQVTLEMKGDRDSGEDVEVWLCRESTTWSPVFISFFILEDAYVIWLVCM